MRLPIANPARPAGHELIGTLRQAVQAVDALFEDARRAVAARVTVEGRTVARMFDREQRATHGLAWLATYVEALRQLAAYARAADGGGQFRRDRGTPGAHRRRRISGADRRRHSDEPGRDRAARRPRARRRAPWRRASNPAVEHLIAYGNTAPRRARLAELIREQQEATDRRLRPRRHARLDPRGDAQIRRRAGRAARAGMASARQLHPARRHRANVRARRVRPDHPRGLRRHGARQGIDVRRLRGAVARLYRRRLARHPLRDRGRAHSRQRHRRAEAAVAAEDRLRRSAADRGVHRAQYRLRSRLAEDPRGARGRRLQGLRQQDLDHASGARRSDDAAGAHQSGREGLSRPLHAARRKAARQRRRSVPGRRHVGHRDRGARLSRHEGIRDRLRRLQGARPTICSAASKGRASSS